MRAERPTAWQRVLHGGAQTLREAVVRVLTEEKATKTGERYSMCGMADQLVKDGDQVRVQPMGCGHKLCPRCGRRRGARYAKRIVGWLGHAEHGELWSMVLTQPVKRGEDIRDTRARMAGKQRAYMRSLQRLGMTAAMTCTHIVWSARAGGWHYHVHLLLEFDAGVMTEERLLAKWREHAAPEKVHTGGKQCRKIIGAGGPIVELRDDSGDTDFWSEAAHGVARAVQYPLRDVVQGVSAWRLGGDAKQIDACARELVRYTSGWKCFRAWGKWRQSCPAAVEAAKEEKAAEEEEAAKQATPAGAVPLGKVGRLFRAARAGCAEAQEAFRLLEGSCRNQSDFAKRLVKYCRLAWQPSQVT